MTVERVKRDPHQKQGAKGGKRIMQQMIKTDYYPKEKAHKLS